MFFNKNNIVEDGIFIACQDKDELSPAVARN